MTYVAKRATKCSSEVDWSDGCSAHSSNVVTTPTIDPGSKMIGLARSSRQDVAKIPSRSPAAFARISAALQRGRERPFDLTDAAHDCVRRRRIGRERFV